jgi:hypothetical protein
MVLGAGTIALLELLGERDGVDEIHALAETFSVDDLARLGAERAARLAGTIPILYSSERNANLAYIWKIMLNETGKTPAFCNVVPEANHNEIEGFASAAPKKPFSVLLLADPEDDPRIQKRMDVFARTIQNVRIERVMLDGSTFQGIFSCAIEAAWTAYHVAIASGADPETTPMIEAFKDQMRAV